MLDMRLPIRSMKVVVAAASICVLASLALAQEPADRLVGLWKASKSFGPDIRGPLIIEAAEERWLADVSGFTVAGTVNRNRIEFELPGEQGRFAGTLEPGGNGLGGHWIQPPPMQIGLAVASPVRFTRIGPNRWQGNIVPRESEYTFYLPVTEADDGTLKTFLRNPDRNLGVFVDIQKIARKDDDVSFDLVGTFFRGDELQVLTEGFYDPDFDQLTLFLPRNRGGTYDFSRVGDENVPGFFARGKSPRTFRYRPPPALDDGWQTGTLEEFGIVPGPILEMIEKEIDPPASDVHAPYVHGFLVARHGKLLMEEYFHGFHRNEPHDTRSASKSLMSLLVGAAIEQGLIDSTAIPVYETLYEERLGASIPADLDPRKKRMTLEHLLTMSSGYYCDDRDYDAPGNEETMQEQEAEPDWYRYTLEVPMISEPGETAVYCSANPNLAGAVLSTATGTALIDLFERLIAGPLDIERYWLILQPSGEPYMGGGMHWLPRDFMKLGQLMINGGTWNGKRIVSEEWSRRSVSPLVELRERQYGYLWWIIDYPYGDRTVKAFFAGGNGGQVIAGIPELDLVVAFYAGNYSDPVLYKIQEEFIPEYILPAVAGVAGE